MLSTMKKKMEKINKQFLNLFNFMLFLISWKNFFLRIFQEIRKKEDDAQNSWGIINIQIIKLNQLRLNLWDVDGSKIENKLFIIKIYN